MKKKIITTNKPTEEEIARLAYTLFEESGRQDGHDVEHWLQAQAHLCADNEHSDMGALDLRARRSVPSTSTAETASDPTRF